MTAPTLELLAGVVARLTERLPGLAVELVPESDKPPACCTRRRRCG